MRRLFLHALAAVALATPAPRLASAGPDASPLPPETVVMSRRRLTVGQGVHFALDPTILGALAAEADVSPRRFRREAEYAWSFSASSTEDYLFDALPTDMNGPRSAGAAVGPFAAHVYETPGRHRVSVEIMFRGARHRAVSAVMVVGDATPATRVAVVDPDGDWSGAPPHRHAFIDLDDALDALSRGVFDTLLLRRGRRYPLDGAPVPQTGRRRAGYQLRTGQTIDAFGDPSKESPVIAPVFGPNGLEAYDPVLRASGDGESRLFRAGERLDGPLSIYVDGRLLEMARDVERLRAGIRFRTPPPRGAAIRVFRRRDDAGSIPRGGGSLLRVRNAQDVRIRNVAFRGTYDPSAPGWFDPVDLSSYDHAVHIAAIETFGDVRDLTLFGVNISGLKTALLGLRGQGPVFIANSRIRDWSDYGIFMMEADRAAVIGSEIRQALGARRGRGGRALNRPGVPNFADHGPIRARSSFRQIISRSRLESRTGWSQGRDGPAPQPIARLAASAVAGQSFAISESHATGGFISIVAGVPNPWTPVPRADLVYIAHNWLELDAHGRRFFDIQTPLTSLNNIYVKAEVRDPHDFMVFGGRRRGPYLSSPDIHLDPPLSINDTFLILSDSPEARLLLTRPAGLTARGVLNAVSLDRAGGEIGPFRVEAGVSEIVVPVRVPRRLSADDTPWRIWRIPPGGRPRDARAYDTLEAQSAAYAVSTSGDLAPGEARSLVVRLRSGRFAEGERVIVSREPLVEANGALDGAGRVVRPTGGPDRFHVNNPERPVALPEAELRNPLIVVDGRWRSFRVRASGPERDPADYRSARLAPLGPHLEPLPGSPALGAGAADEAAARGFRGRPRADPPSLGALEAGPPLPGGAPPRAPTVSLTWRAGVAEAGAPLPRDAIRLDIEAGAPPLDREAVALRLVLRRDDAWRPLAPGEPLRFGDRVLALAAWAHPATGRETLRSEPLDVPPGSD